MSAAYAYYWREHPRRPGRWVYMRQTPQQAWRYDIHWYGVSVALRNWMDWYEMVVSLALHAMRGDGPLWVDAPMDDGEWS